MTIQSNTEKTEPRPGFLESLTPEQIESFIEIHESGVKNLRELVEIHRNKAEMIGRDYHEAKQRVDEYSKVLGREQVRLSYLLELRDTQKTDKQNKKS